MFSMSYSLYLNHSQSLLPIFYCLVLIESALPIEGDFITVMFSGKSMVSHYVAIDDNDVAGVLEKYFAKPRMNELL